MRTLENMTLDELRQYLAMLGEATEEVMPPGPSKKGRALFCILIFGSGEPGGDAHYVSNCDRTNIPTALREAADMIEAAP